MAAAAVVQVLAHVARATRGVAYDPVVVGLLSPLVNTTATREFGRWWVPPNVPLSVFDEQRRAHAGSESLFVPSIFDITEMVLWTVIISAVRLLLTALVFRPLGLLLLPPRFTPFMRHARAAQERFDRIYMRGLEQDASERDVVADIVKEGGVSRAAAEAWFEARQVRRSALDDRMRKAQARMAKWCESMWRLTYYTVAVVCGYLMLRERPYWSDTTNAWHNYPHVATFGERYYYTLQVAFYVHACVWIFLEERKADFWEMLTHHVVTIFLILFSYWSSMFRVGTLVLLVHDVSDPLMEMAKVIKYSGRVQILCDAFFTLFAVTFWVSRLYVFPMHVINCALVESRDIIGYWNAWAMLNGMLLTLLALHVYWSFLIARMVYRFVRDGQVSKDDRSESETDDGGEGAAAAVAEAEAEAKKNK